MPHPPLFVFALLFGKNKNCWTGIFVVQIWIVLECSIWWTITSIISLIDLQPFQFYLSMVSNWICSIGRLCSLTNKLLLCGFAGLQLETRPFINDAAFTLPIWQLSNWVCSKSRLASGALKLNQVVTKQPWQMATSRLFTKLTRPECRALY